MTLLKDIKVEARIVLASQQLRLRDVLRLERGSVVPLDGTADRPSELQVNGVAVALGQIQIDGENSAFRVSHVVPRD